MNMKKSDSTQYIIIILFLLFPFIFYFWSRSRLPQAERFKTANGCYWKYLDGPCVTSKFSPSMVNIVNKEYKRDCSQYKNSHSCIGNKNVIIDEEDQNYYCQVDGECKERLIDIKNPAANNCGYNNLSERSNNTFLTKEQCVNNIDLCEKNNDSIHRCLENSMCGWCTGSDGNGKCVSGSPIGANNPIYKCRPQTGQNIYNWKYGNGLSFK